MRHRTLVACLLALAVSSCGGSTPTSPTRLSGDVEVGGSTFTAPGVKFTRDFAPIQAKPGSDGGGPLQGSVGLTIEHHGAANDFKLAVSIYDETGATRYPVVAVAHDYDRVPTFWDGHMGPGQRRHIELQLSDGPYLPAGSKAFAVITVTDAAGHTGSLRTVAATIARTD